MLCGSLNNPLPPLRFRCNLRNHSPTHLSSLVSSALPPLTTFSSLGVNDATESLCSTLSSCLDSLCPLSTRPAQSTQSHSWLSDTLRTQCSNLRVAERKWHKSAAPDDLASYQTLLSSFSSSITAAEKTFYKDKINSATELFFIFKTLLYPPPPATNLTADTFASFFTEKVAAIRNQFNQLSPLSKGKTING